MYSSRARVFLKYISVLLSPLQRETSYFCLERGNVQIGSHMLVFVEGEVMLKVDKVVLGVDWDWAQFEVEHFLEEEFDASTIM